MEAVKSNLLSFEDLDCWKACREVRRYIITVVKKFPADEKYALSSGIRRSSRSITENMLKDLDGFTIRKIFNFVVIAGAHYMKL